MAKIFRVAGFHQGKINANIEDVWALVMDWGSLAWYDGETNAENLQLVQTWLEGDPNVVPRTRVMARGDGAVAAGCAVENREVLLIADPVAHRLYYDASDGFVPGIRNYLASWAFDELEDGGCMITISSNFDCVPAETGEASRDMLHQVYINIAASLDKHFAKARAVEKTS